MLSKIVRNWYRMFENFCETNFVSLLNIYIAVPYCTASYEKLRISYFIINFVRNIVLYVDGTTATLCTSILSSLQAVKIIHVYV